MTTEGSAVDAVDAVEFDPSAIDEKGNGAGHTHSFIVEIAAAGSGEDNQGDCPMAVNLQGHRVSETEAYPAMFFKMHFLIILGLQPVFIEGVEPINLALMVAEKVIMGRKVG